MVELAALTESPVDDDADHEVPVPLQLIVDAPSTTERVAEPVLAVNVLKEHVWPLVLRVPLVRVTVPEHV